MITVTLSRPAGLGAINVGPFDSVKRLQEALLAYAVATHDTALTKRLKDSGAPNGFPEAATIDAVAQILPQITGQLSSTLSVALQIALVALDEGKKRDAVVQAADELAAAILAYTAKLVVGGSKPTSPVKILQPGVFRPGTSSPSAPGALYPTMPWYKRWWGLTAIGVSAMTVAALIIVAIRGRSSAPVAGSGERWHRARRRRHA